MRPIDKAIRLLKMSLAAGLSWYLASLVSPHRPPYFAPLAVVIVFQATAAETAAKAWYRCAGIVGGVAVSLLVSRWMHVGALTIALAVFIGVAICTLFDVEPQITSQVGVTVVMVLASSSTPHYAEYRILETLLGAVVAVVVNAALMPPSGLPLAEQRVRETAELLAGHLLALSRAPQDTTGTPVEPIARKIDQQMRSSSNALRTAESSLKLNPFSQSGRTRLKQLTAAMAEVEKIGIQVRGIARGLDDLGPRASNCEPWLSDALTDTAACVAAFGQAVANASGQASGAVERAVARARRSQTECLAHLKETAALADMRDLGAICADLDRILTEVRADPSGDITQAPVSQAVAYGHD